MPDVGNGEKTKLINRVASLTGKAVRASEAAKIRQFTRQYFYHVPPEDLAGRDPAALYAAVLAHWKTGHTRGHNKSRVRVFNPRQRKDGWKADITVIEIITDDMPFLVDSIATELNRRGMTVHLAIHPVIRVHRSKTGRLTKVMERGKTDLSAIVESYIYLEVTEQPDSRHEEIREGVKGVLRDVRSAVEDWRKMRLAMSAVIEDQDLLPSNIPASEASEVVDFLQWIHDNHFTFLGYRDYGFKGSGRSTKVTVNKRSGLGLLRDAKRTVFSELRTLRSMPPEVRSFVERPDILLVSKTNMLSTVHRPVHMDMLGIKRFDDRGKVVGLRLFVGLFTSVAYSLSPRDIPLLRLKLQNTIERAGFPAASHNGKALAHILETFPRDELFQVSEKHLMQTGLGILHLQERQRVALFIRRDDFERFISCLIYVPRDRYTTELRHKMQSILETAFDGRVTAQYSQLGDSPLARFHMIIHTTPGKIPPYKPAVIEQQLVEAARSWQDNLKEAIIEDKGESGGLVLFDRYQDAFPPGYSDRFVGPAALADIDNIEDTLASGGIGMSLYRPDGGEDNRIGFKIYHPERPIPLSDILPMLEHMGLKVMDEMPFAVRPADGDDEGRLVMIHDFGLQTRDGSAVDLKAVAVNFQDAFRRVWFGDMESDGFNGLVLGAGLDWRQVSILRAYSKYLRQAGIAFSQAYMEQTLANNPGLACTIVNLFQARFNPAKTRTSKGAAGIHRAALDVGLEDVASADEDRILRRFINLVEQTRRTNFYQPDGDGNIKPYISFKLDSQKLDDLPLPRPMVEIFVYSPRVEGVHLRFGSVARGGLRWSDRREDFRTEILGLVKAQQVKNAVIVPVGSKGGFVVKRPPTEGGREAFLEEGIACYKTFISGLLDLTDNLKGNRVVPPADVVRHDGDDPYLVVAADKGTATFSDIANGISEDYGFWLGDAFASGGSVGYDHKKMGITAKGGWESVKRHFRETGTDIQNEDFTVVGVGDMSGDVFGNGMLLSRHIKLVAAFNHLHIFVDPDPDPAKSFAERKRLFKLPRSNWADYDKKVLSKGAAIFDRSAKSLKLTPEIKRRFAIIKDTVTPTELMRAVLTASVDLLWFGGIGSYIKSTSETHADAGDRANDAIRVNAPDLRCRVVGEGANLGVTQRARIEFALGGGRINTDSIDNSAGVDCSDHEVNIKILLDQVAATGKLARKQRNKMLADMTNEVSDLVLRDNYLQTQAMTLIQSSAAAAIDNQIRLIRMLERTGRLNREVEFLPDDETLEERITTGKFLTRPEIAILMSYAKIWLYDELLQSTLPDDAYLTVELNTYFPTLIQQKLRPAIGKHRLKREIIATRATNELINRAGGTFVTQLMEKTGMLPSDIARAFDITRLVYGLDELWDGIEALDNKIPASLQTAMLQEINRLIERATVWLLRNGAHPMDIGKHVKEFSGGIATLIRDLDKALPEHYADDLKQRAQPYIAQGVPEALAVRIAGLVNMVSGCDIVRLAASRKLDVKAAARLFFSIGTRFHLGRLRASCENLEAESHWQKLAVAALIEELYGHQLALTSQVLDYAGTKANAEKAIGIWAEKNRVAVERAETLLNELWSGEIDDFSMIAVASRQIRALTESQKE
ncbi:MAG: NAD-glutamate dehydrogenase [Rhodospirillales bacterium]|nr:NAD-glutamate dehydrogenase [Rhodospirillales bacterium]